MTEAVEDPEVATRGYLTRIEWGATLEEMGIALNKRIAELVADRMHIVSVSHAVDPTSEERRYTAVIVSHDVELKQYV